MVQQSVTCGSVHNSTTVDPLISEHQGTGSCLVVQNVRICKTPHFQQKQSMTLFNVHQNFIEFH